jgi:hypothetical protein
MAVDCTLSPDEVETILRLEDGTAERLARRGQLPHFVLPGGAVRFDLVPIGKLIEQGPPYARPYRPWLHLWALLRRLLHRPCGKTVRP